MKELVEKRIQEICREGFGDAREEEIERLMKEVAVLRSEHGNCEDEVLCGY